MSGREFLCPNSGGVARGLEAQYANSNTVRFLDLIKPFTPLLPEVSSPESKVPFNSKLMWTGREHTPNTNKSHD